MKIICFACNKPFECGADFKDCFCRRLPAIDILAKHDTCLCEPCLSLHIERTRGPLSCFRLMISYVGTNFLGFQAQKDARTVEGELKKAILKITGHHVKIRAAGRTDAGVHARAQAVSVKFYTLLSERQLTLALASNLPPDMSVWRVDRMPLDFDARQQSIGKRYVYRIYQGLVASPFYQDALFVRTPLDVSAMAKASKFFVGEHDFTSFRSSLCDSASAVRYIWHVRVSENGNLIEIDIRGNAFCLNMVRIMAGTLIEVGKHKRPPDDVRSALLGKNRILAGATAKAHGLTLVQIYYPDNLSDSLLPESASFPRYPITKETWNYGPNDIQYGPT